MKQDLTQQGPLAMLRWCKEDQVLKNAWHESLMADDFGLLLTLLDEWFEYTPEQLKEVREEWEVEADGRY